MQISNKYMLKNYPAYEHMTASEKEQFQAMVIEDLTEPNKINKGFLVDLECTVIQREAQKVINEQTRMYEHDASAKEVFNCGCAVIGASVTAIKAEIKRWWHSPF